MSPRRGLRHERRSSVRRRPASAGCRCRWPSSTAAPTTPRRPSTGTMPPTASGRRRSSCSASAAVVAYAERGEPDAELGERLQNLARPALGHWWEFVRLLVPAPGRRRRRRVSAPSATWSWAASATTCPAPPGSMPRCARPWTAPGARVTVRLSELFDRLVRVPEPRDRPRRPRPAPAEFYDRMGRALLLGVGELLGRLDVLAGRRLIYVDRRPPPVLGRLAGRAVRAGGRSRPDGSNRSNGPSRRPRACPGRGGSTSRGPRSPSEPSPPGRYTRCCSSTTRRPRSSSSTPAAASGGSNTSATPRPDLDRDDLGAERATFAGPGPERRGRRRAGRASGRRSRRPKSRRRRAPEARRRRRLGEFELLSELGRGGMGVVYRAWQPSLGRQVALKCLLRAGDPKAEARFKREIRALGRVEHPHLVKVYTSGRRGRPVVLRDGAGRGGDRWRPSADP